jgi:hypothetical protein
MQVDFQSQIREKHKQNVSLLSIDEKIFITQQYKQQESGNYILFGWQISNLVHGKFITKALAKKGIGIYHISIGHTITKSEFNLISNAI